MELFDVISKELSNLFQEDVRCVFGPSKNIDDCNQSEQEFIALCFAVSVICKNPTFIGCEKNKQNIEVYTYQPKEEVWNAIFGNDEPEECDWYLLQGDTPQNYVIISCEENIKESLINEINYIYRDIYDFCDEFGDPCYGFGHVFTSCEEVFNLGNISFIRYRLNDQWLANVKEASKNKGYTGLNTEEMNLFKFYEDIIRPSTKKD